VASALSDPDEAVASVGERVTKETFTLGTLDAPFVLENRQILPQVQVAYETYGTLSEKKDNAVLVCHGITGSSHAAGKYAPENRSVGYWDGLIGPGKVFDTDRYFVVAPNALGGCRGSTGPSSINPETGRAYGLRFPIVTVRDIVRVQQRFLSEKFGIERLKVVAGGSMGGMQALEWAVMFPERVEACIPIATCARTGTRAIAFNEVARRAILLDPNFAQGDYYELPPEQRPNGGLALARMISTITYLTDSVLQELFGRKKSEEETSLSRELHARFDIERYLHDEGEKLVKRFDANSYLYLSRAIDLHDVSRGYSSLAEALERIQARLLLIGVTSDDLFPIRQTDEIYAILQARGRPVERFVVQSEYGHDAFLVEAAQMRPALRAFLRTLDGPVTNEAQREVATDARRLAALRLRGGKRL
jgi:homoserine O-acetyltransferase/O-succinyltransferase